MHTLPQPSRSQPRHAPVTARLGVVAALVVLLARVAAAPAPAMAASSPLGDSAAAWPAGWSSYSLSTGAPVIDVEDEPGISPDNVDLASNNGVVATPLMSFDGTTAFFRLRLMGDPRDAAKGGFDNATWLLHIATASDDVSRAVVGVNGKPVNTDYVYVADAPGNAIPIYETPFDSSGGQQSAGARGLSDGAGQYFLDFQVPIARITQVSGGAITASTPVKLFYGSSTAANLATINKDYMTGSSVSFAGLAAITMGPAHLVVDKTRTHVSGPNPPEVGETSVYDMTLSARNDGGNAATSVTATDTIPAGVTIESMSTGTGSISRSGQDVTWSIGTLPAGGPAVTATVRVSVTPTNADWNTTLSLNPGASFGATDGGTGAALAETTGSLSAGPVAGNRFPDALDDSATSTDDAAVVLDVLANDTDPDGPLDPASVSITGAATQGSTSVNPVTGAITYTPDAGATGTDDFRYRVCDTGSPARCDIAVVTITLRHTPAASDDSATLAEDGSTTVDVVANDTDVDGNLSPSTVSVTGAPAHGSTSVNGTTGAITYTPDTNWNGSDSLTYEICDTTGLCDTATVSLVVTAVNDTPVANDDSATLDEDGSTTVDVAANDTDIDGNLDSTSVSVTSGPSHGSYSVNPVTGAITYTPDANWNGADGLTYQVCDSSSACDTATVSFTVTAVTDDPVANDDSATLAENGSVTVDVVANDTDVDGDLDATSVSVTSGPSHGSVSINPVTGAITYTPDANWNGADSLTYEVCDSAAVCDTATVSFTVTPLNSAPVAGDDATTLAEDGSTTVDVAANDTDIDGNLDATSVSVTSGPSHGSYSINPVTGAITYTPDADWNGADSLTYEICDLGGLCDTATISFTVTAVNDDPVANDDSATVPEDGSTTIDVAANDTDVDGNLDPTSVNVTSGPSHGSVSINPVTGAITYTPDADYTGPDSLTYEVCDSDDACDTATVSFTVTAGNDAPVANDDAVTLAEDGSTTVDVVANDTDVDGNLDATSVTVTSGPSHGSYSVNPVTGAITYTPDADFNGTDSLTYEVCDSALACDTATVSFTVTAVNDAPVANDDTSLLGEDASATVDVVANDSDVDGNLDPTTVSVTGGPSHGTVSVDATTGAITYTPDADWNGADSLTYEICDTDDACDTATVSFTIAAVNDAPVAGDDAATTDEDTAVTVDVAANDSDVDGDLDATTVNVLSGPLDGVVSVNPVTGAITYAPDADFNGTDSLTYEICDSADACDTATVSFTVTAVGDAPVAADDTATTDEDTGMTVDVVANDSDADGDLDPASVSVLSGPSHGTVTVDPATGAITYTPGADYNGPDSLTYEICDGDGACDTATVSFTVDPVSDDPVAADDSATTDEDTGVVVDVAANDTDADGNLDVTSVTVLSGPTDGSASVDALTGEITYTPNADVNGADSLVYQVCDGAGACDTATVSFTVMAVADDPVAADDSATTDEDTAVVVDVAANDSDADGDLDVTSVTVLSGPSDGLASVDPVTGAITYTPNAGFAGSDSLAYEICDGADACDTATVSITVGGLNDAPVAADDGATTDEDTVIEVDVAANDTDEDGNLDVSSVTVLSGPAHGLAGVDTATGAITYTPDADFNGTDSLTYEICDTDAVCDTATVTFTVTAVNDDPVANDDTASIAGEGSVVVDVLDNDIDVDGTLNPASVTVTSGPANGSVTIDSASGVITYSPDAGFAGVDQFVYEVCDDGGACATATVRVSVNGAPIADDDTAATVGGTPVAIDVLDNDTDPDGSLDPDTLRVIDGPSQGTVSVDPDTGVVTYTPDADASGTDTFRYEICDTDEPQACAAATVTVNVNGRPVAGDDTVAVETDGSVVVDPLANDHDLDGDLDPASVAVIDPPEHGTVTVDPDTGRITYVPDEGFSGADAFTYQVCDTGDPVACATARVAVLVGAPATTTLEGIAGRLLADAGSTATWAILLGAGILAAAWVIATARRRGDRAGS